MIRIRRAVVVLPLSIVLFAGLAACDKKDDATPPVTQPSAIPSAQPSAAPSASVSAAPSASAEPTPSASTAPSAAPTPSASTKASATASAAPGPLKCGTKPLPDCPLQGWMKANVNPPVAAGDTAKLGEVLDKISKMGPPGYGNWKSISLDGAKAAKGGDLDAAKASCRTCHDQYKAKYRAELRDRKI